MTVRTTKSGDSRFYFDTNDPDRKIPGVTSVLDMLNKPFLPPWYARLAAERAVTYHEKVGAMLDAGDIPGALRFIKGAAPSYNKVRRDIGTQAHTIFEKMLRGEPLGRVSADMRPYRDNFAEFLRAVNPELLYAENTAWSDRYDYAGRFDAILRIWYDNEGNIAPDRSGTPRDEICDWKTSKDPHAEVAMQLKAYSRADWMVWPDGRRQIFPAVDGGYVLHITPETWDFIPVEFDDGVFASFLALRTAFEWDRVLSRTALGAPAASGGKGR